MSESAEQPPTILIQVGATLSAIPGPRATEACARAQKGLTNISESVIEKILEWLTKLDSIYEGENPDSLDKIAAFGPLSPTTIEKEFNKNKHVVFAGFDSVDLTAIFSVITLVKLRQAASAVQSVRQSGTPWHASISDAVAFASRARSYIRFVDRHKKKSGKHGFVKSKKFALTQFRSHLEAFFQANPTKKNAKRKEIIDKVGESLKENGLKVPEKTETLISWFNIELTIIKSKLDKTG